MLTRHEFKSLLSARLYRKALHRQGSAFWRCEKLLRDVREFLKEMKAAGHLDLPWFEETPRLESLEALMQVRVGQDRELIIAAKPLLDFLYPPGIGVEAKKLPPGAAQVRKEAVKSGGRFVDLTEDNT